MPRAAKKAAPKKKAPAKKKAAAKKSSSLEFKNFKPYKPKRGEQYMSDGQREHFKNILLK